MTDDTTTLEASVLRQVCGLWVTGVAIVLGTSADSAHHGMAVNSFTSLSLEPPLVLFCAAATSTTWPHIRATGRFAVDILTADQNELARSFARSGVDKFAGVPIRETVDGLPAIDGAAARLVCEIDQIHRGGDHEIVVGRVRHAEEFGTADPLLFHRGRTPAYRFL